MNSGVDLLVVLAGLAAGLAVALTISMAVACVVWFLYNIVIQPCFPGWPHVSFWATWAILGFIRLVTFIARGK